MISITGEGRYEPLILSLEILVMFFLKKRILSILNIHTQGKEKKS